MDIKNFLQNRKDAESSLGEVVGEHNIEKLGVLFNNNKDLLKDITTGIIVQAAESCRYSSEEFKIFTAGTKTVLHFMDACGYDIDSKKAEKEAQEKKKAKKKPTY
jgi:prophage tail gpP-like protein